MADRLKHQVSKMAMATTLLALPLYMSCLRLCCLASTTGFTYSGAGGNSTLTISGNVSSVDDTILLDASSGIDAAAIFRNSLQIYDTSTAGLLSFTTQFTFTSNSSTGVLAFVLVKNSSTALLRDARLNGLTVEFTTACAGATDLNETYAWPPYGFGYGHWHGRGGYGPGGPGQFGTVEYINGTPYTPVFPSWTYNGSNWDPDNSTDNDNCTLPSPNSYPSYLFEVIIQYNASTGYLLVGSPTCSIGPHVYNFSAAAIAGNFSGEPYAGLISDGGGIYNVTQWNFTTNGTDAFTSLSMVVNGGNLDGSGSGGGDYRGGGGKGDGGLSKGAKLGIGIGAAVAGVVLVAACCACFVGRRRRNGAAAGVVMKGVPPPPPPKVSGQAMVFGVTKTLEVTERERDTTPLTRNASASSTTTVTASWLPPVAPR